MNTEKSIQYQRKWLYKTSGRKPVNFYKNIVNVKPEIQEQFLTNMNKIGYWKDYLYLLEYSNNMELNNKILTLLVEQYHKDVFNMAMNKPISNLAKYLPRKGTHFDKKLNFVNVFSKMVYPKDNVIKATTRYRKTVVKICEKLGVPERYVCTKEWDKIDVDKVSINFLLKNLDTLMEKNDKQKVVSRFINFTGNCSVFQFMKKVLKQDGKYFEKYQQLFNKVWSTYVTKYYKEVEDIVKFTGKENIILDIDNESYTLYKHIFVTLVLIGNLQGCSIIMNSYNPKEINLKNKEFYDQVQEILTNVSTYKDIRILDDKPVVVITKKPCQQVKGMWIQLSPDSIIREEKRDTVIIKGSPNKPVNRKDKFVNTIIPVKQSQANKNSTVYKVLDLIIIFLIVSFFLFSFYLART